jgi:arylformamidase
MPLARRLMMTGTLSALAASCPRAPSQAQAQSADHPFLLYRQADLDIAYDQLAWAPNQAAIVGRYAKDSAQVRRLMPPRTESYGPSGAETLDIFAPPIAGRLPIHVFIHGGAWRGLSKDDASAPAPTFVELGAIYIALNFANIPAVRLPEMAEQCRAALRWIAANAARFGGNADRITLSGHSSGAHLAAVLLTTDWTASGLPGDLIKHGLLMSGIYDLYPVMLSSRRNYVKLSAEEVTALSPIRHLDRIACPVHVAWGDLESPEFKRQNMLMADALAGMGRLQGRFTLFNHNHFEVVEQLNRPDSTLGRAALQAMGLG